MKERNDHMTMYKEGLKRASDAKKAAASAHACDEQKQGQKPAEE